MGLSPLHENQFGMTPVNPHTSAPFRPAQFGLKSIFAFTSAVAFILGALRWLGYLPAIACLLFAIAMTIGYAVPARKGGKLLAAACAIIAAGLALLAPAMRPPACTATRRSMCYNNLKQISFALQNYADVYGRLPPVYVADENGRPMHSWRVLILPFLEEKWLYDQYDFNEPWDGPHNRLLAKHIPPMYRCPSDPSTSRTTTNYLAVTGKETVWPGTGCTALCDVSDGLGDTIAVVEVASSGVDWMEPRDLPMAEFVKGINRSDVVGASSHHPSGSHAVCCDGHVKFLQNQLSASTLKALATRRGDEPLPRDK